MVNGAYVMSQKNKILWRSKLPQFWRTATKYRKLLVSLGVWMIVFLWIGIYFFPYQHSTDIILPQGFFKSSFVLIEKLDTENDIFVPDSSYPVSVNSYLEKRNELIRGYVRLFQNTVTDATLSQLSRHTNLFPVKSYKKERSVQVRAIKDKGYVVSLLDENFNELDQTVIKGGYFHYIVSARFKDRLWIQVSAGGNSGYLALYEVNIFKDHLQVHLIGDGDEDYTGYQTYKIINPTTNPRVFIHRRSFSLFTVFMFPMLLVYELLDMGFLELLFWILLISVGFFILSFLLDPKKLKPHLFYIRKTFLSLFSKHLHD